MRTSLAAFIGMTLFATACGGSSSGTTGTTGTSGGIGAGSSTGAAATGSAAGSSSGGAPTGTGAGTTGGGGIAAGDPCTSNTACTSGVCGTDGTGLCCTAACATSDATCGATACDDTGACTYPTAGGACGTATCADGMLTPAGTCSGTGTCAPGTPTACANNFVCNAAGTACGTSCTTSADCAATFVCNGGACVTPAAVGTCTENDDCTSQVCGLNGTGSCCTTACAATTDPACDPTSCDVGSGACVYPTGATCGTDSCTASSLTTNACDDTGACQPATPTACPNNLNCSADGTTCETTCAATTDCVTGFYCAVAAGTCDAQIAAGPCTENDACISDVCGVAGSGHCCTAACASTVATCAATDCDNVTAACTYPGASISCGTTLASCSNDIQQSPSVCDGMGNCPTPLPASCNDYACNAVATACDSSCTDNSSCANAPTNFCDVANTTCCNGLTNAIAVDSVNGSDANACCGIGSNGPCQTLTQAMALINAAQVSNVVITATVAGGGGDWAPAGEVYPITLGWGVELSAPGVYFNDNAGNAEIFDINFYPGGTDTIGYASIAGTSGSNVFIGMDSLGDQATDNSEIQVEASNTLYIANASVNGSANLGTTAITVTAGGSLVLGEDQPNVVTGTVTIGNALNVGNPNGQGQTTDGYDGIVCGTGNGLGCTITDATLTGTSSVIIEGQEGVDIDAEDFANITLTSAPTIGIAPTATGFNECVFKPDGISGAVNPTTRGAIWLDGDVTMTFSNGFVQCVFGNGFYLNDSPNGNGGPTLTLTGTTIQNAGLWAIYASDGTATVSNSTIEYNANGVEEDTDIVNGTTGSIDLSGGGVGGNTVICSNTTEDMFDGLGGAGQDTPAVSVLNNTVNSLDADDVIWDTPGPDLFSCAPLTTCVCDIMTCTNPGGVDGMDAVEESSGAITQANPGLSGANCTAQCGPTNPCPGGGTCCPGTPPALNTCSLTGC